VTIVFVVPGRFWKFGSQIQFLFETILNVLNIKWKSHPQFFEIITRKFSYPQKNGIKIAILIKAVRVFWLTDEH
jgi:hypothetical protein